MIRPECKDCEYLNRNQCELDKKNPINMEIGDIIEYVTDPVKDRSCKSYKGREPVAGN
jgi:hypothetical protein